MTLPSSSSQLESLASPPIVEVICGVHFTPIRGLDPLAIGGYWTRRRDAFPEHQIHPALEEGPPGLHLRHAVGPLRVWLVSGDGAFVVQVQHDRFYLNWRARGHEYPRFRGDEGLLDRCLREFEAFSGYCDAAEMPHPSPERIELGKVDSFVEGRDWSGPDDLATMIPMLAPVLTLHRTDHPDVAIRFQEAREDHVLRVAMNNTALVGPDGDDRVVRAIRLETTVINGLDSGGLRAGFELANQQANAVFSSLVPKDQRDKRFNENRRE